MKVKLTTCFVIHTRAYLESSLLLDVFSRQYGRVDMVAKGIRRNKSRFAGLLQPYQRLQISWVGKRELMTLTDVEEDTPAYAILGNKKIFAFYINELLSKLLHRHEPHPQLFELYEKTITELAATGHGDVILRNFEKGLLQSLGYGLSLEYDIDDGQRIEADKQYYYLLNKGPSKHIPVTNDYVKISGNSLLALLKGNPATKIELTEIKYLMRSILHIHLDGKPLSSRALYKAYLNNASNNASSQQNS